MMVLLVPRWPTVHCVSIIWHWPFGEEDFVAHVLSRRGEVALAGLVRLCVLLSRILGQLTPSTIPTAAAFPNSTTFRRFRNLRDRGLRAIQPTFLLPQLLNYRPSLLQLSLLIRQLRLHQHLSLIHLIHLRPIVLLYLRELRLQLIHHSLICFSLLGYLRFVSILILQLNGANIVLLIR